jgi:hypothetical protein
MVLYKMNTYIVIFVVVIMLSSAMVAYAYFTSRAFNGDKIGEPCALAPAKHNCRPGLVCDHESGTCQKHELFS